MARKSIEEKLSEYWLDVADKYYSGRHVISPKDLLLLRKDPNFIRFEEDLKNFIIKNHKKELTYKITTLIEEYVGEVVGGRWFEMEPYILKTQDFYWTYCENVFGGRWSELEEKLIRERNLENILNYAEIVIQGRWDEFEKIGIQELKKLDFFFSDFVHGCVRYCITNKFRWPEFEDYLLNIDFSKFNKDTSKEILENILWYSLEVVDGRWTEAENLIIKRIGLARKYVLNKKFKWPLYESKIKNKPAYLYQYAREALESRLSEELHNRMIMENLRNDDHAKAYFNFLKTNEETVIRYLSCMTKEERNNFMERFTH